MEWEKSAIVLWAWWIGAETVNMLALRCIKVRAVVHSRVTKILKDAHEQLHNYIEIVQTDLRKIENVRGALNFWQNPLVYQFAARAFGSRHTGSTAENTEVLADFEGNAQINANVAEVVKEMHAGGKPIDSLSFSSSYFTYLAGKHLGKEVSDKPFVETDLDPKNFTEEELETLKAKQPYLWEKILTENRYQELSQDGIRIHRFRFWNVYGAGQRHVPEYPHLMPEFFSQNNGKEEGNFSIFGDGKQTRAWINVSDVVNGVLRVSLNEKSWSSLHNLGGTRHASGHTTQEVVQHMAESLGVKMVYQYDTASPAWQSIEMNSQKALIDHGWLPHIPLHVWLRRAMEFYKKNGLGD